ncbi:MAG TPA: LacI family DNA-binding transcriptional regulator [Bauldia sp.]|nr:LacI family DNA-binding transcriptional regulator [Bauldia sp.]
MASRSRNQGKSFTSAREVAERAGVSRSAVSRTFTDGASVSAATRHKVLTAAEELGYHVNHLARGLIRESSGIVCLIVADANTPNHAKMLETLTRHLQAVNKVAMVINTAGDHERVERAVRQTLHYRADATVVLSGTPPASLIDTCINNGQRVILINRDEYKKGPAIVMVDNQRAAREAFLMFRRAGCEKFAVVSSSAGTPSLTGRETAFVAAAKEAGFDVSVVRHGPTAYVSGSEAAHMLLSRAERPTAVFCVTDLLALGFMDAARHTFALDIPNELCVVGFDDIPEAGWDSYRLTTFRQPVEEIAEWVVGAIDGKQQGAAAQSTVLSAEPVWRQSVRPR